MPPSPGPRQSPAREPLVMAPPPEPSAVPIPAISLEEEGTQTEGALDASFSDVWSADSALEEEEDLDEEEESVIARLSNRLFSRRCRRRDRATQTSREPLAAETERLAFDVVFWALGRKLRTRRRFGGVIDVSSDSDCAASPCLRRAVGRMLERHAPLFNGMVGRLAVDYDSDLHAGFHAISDELFANEEVTWSKIVALYAFGARLAQHCSEHRMNDLVYDVASNLAQFAVERITPFLKRNGGWGTFCEAFPLESDCESKIWRTLVLTGLGLTALATILALQR